MTKRKVITVLALSVMMSSAIGYSGAYNIAYAASNSQAVVNANYNLASAENAALVLDQRSGSNAIALSLELSKEYDRSITSFEISIQLDQSKIKNVTMDWNKAFTTNNCRYTYNKNTGELRIYVVDSKDLLNDRKITIGNMGIVSDDTSKFSSSLVLQEVKTVDLQHNSDVISVGGETHSIAYTPTSTPTNKPSSNNSNTTSYFVYAQEIRLNKTKETIVVGKTLDLTATILPSNASNRTVTWSSDNEKVAKVTADGKVTAIARGKANITARSNDGANIKATAVITVNAKNVKATSVKLSKTSLALKPKASTTLKATVSPSTATDKSVVWSSSNPKVATVVNGKITAKAVGTTIITVTTKDDSKKKATCKITVADIKLNRTKATIAKGKSISLKATVSGKSKSVTWKSSNSKVATVSKTGKVTAKKAGTAVITVKANGVTTVFKVTVK